LAPAPSGPKLGWLHQTTPAKDLTNVPQDRIRRVDHIVVEEPQHQQALTDRLVVPPTILLELTRIQMERQPVDLDDEEALKEEVHCSCAVDPDLCLGPDPHIPEQD